MVTMDRPPSFSTREKPRPKMQSSWWVLAIGVLIHFLILGAVFDLYFSSPIEHGMTPIRSTDRPPAKRVVIMVADGLRVQSLYFSRGYEYVAPNIREINNKRSAWGIAITRVPTESRPGHVALFGGIYEDPSAIFKGWKANPVDFDHVINQSTNAWCWGSPDILPMFNKDNSSHIHLDYYDSSMQDFGQKDTTVLDKWVFDRVTQFLTDRMNCTTCDDLHQSGNIFFLHLLGIDTAGHGFKPGSQQYKDNIRFVDGYIPKIEALFEQFFPDGKTAYIFTADHGMTDWGSHGAGSDHETLTPIITWGSGIQIEDVQQNMQQVDIAPLIASLIGINIPVNSIGMLPYGFLNVDKDNMRTMYLANMKQLLQTYKVKRDKIMKNAFRYVPFIRVTPEALEERVQYLENINIHKDEERFFDNVTRFMLFLTNGADYYHYYYQLPILIAITVGLVGWIIFLATFGFNIPNSELSTEGKYFTLSFAMLGYSLSFYAVNAQNMPMSYHIYFAFPIAMVHVLTNRCFQILGVLKLLKANGFKKSLYTILYYVVALFILVRCFYSREVLSILMLFLGGLIYYSPTLYNISTQFQRWLWAGSCFFLAGFPLLPVMQTTLNLMSYGVGYGLWFYGTQRILVLNKCSSERAKETARAFVYQRFFVIYTPLYALGVYFEFIPLGSLVKFLSWVVAVVPMLYIFSTNADIQERITSTYMAFVPFYLMVSSTYEPVFLSLYCFLLYNWLILEGKIFTFTSFKNISVIDRFSNVYADDFRRAFIFVVLIFLGYFGTGNLASLNSFDPMWAKCFLTIFSPFKMAGIIFLRIVIPFVFTSCIFRCINLYRNADTTKMFCLVLMFSDIMLLQLIYSIDNTGSWLEIGMSLSHFIIMVTFALTLLLLHFVAKFMLTAQYPLFIRRKILSF